MTMMWLYNVQMIPALSSYYLSSLFLTCVPLFSLRVMLSTSLEMKMLPPQMCQSTWSSSLQVCVFMCVFSPASKIILLVFDCILGLCVFQTEPFDCICVCVNIYWQPALITCQSHSSLKGMWRRFVCHLISAICFCFQKKRKENETQHSAEVTAVAAGLWSAFFPVTQNWILTLWVVWQNKTKQQQMSSHIKTVLHSSGMSPSFNPLCLVPILFSDKFETNQRGFTNAVVQSRIQCDERDLKSQT